MKVVILFEESGTVRDAFIKQGHNAWSVDLLPGRGKHIRKHLQIDALGGYNWLRLSVFNQHPDLVIAHPPCTYLCNSGVRWLHTQEGRKQKMREAAILFRDVMNLQCECICVENPIMHKYAVEIVGRKQDQLIQPWQYGHGETKATCLWLKGLPLLKPTNIVEGREARIHRMPPGKDRSKLRSVTYQGIADAMASQWSAGA